MRLDSQIVTISSSDGAYLEIYYRNITVILLLHQCGTTNYNIFLKVNVYLWVNNNI